MTHHEFDHFLSGLGALSPEQVRRLRNELDSRLGTAPAVLDGPALTEAEQAEQELQQRLHKAGLLSEIKPPRHARSELAGFQPIRIEGEPLSETIIRERR